MGLNLARTTNMPVVIAEALCYHGRACILFAFEKPEYESTAIQSLEESLKICSQFIDSKDRMAVLFQELMIAYLLPKSRQDQSNIEKAIMIGHQYEALAKQLKLDAKSDTKTLVSMADAYRHRAAGDRIENLQAAEHFLRIAFQEYDDQTLIRSLPIAVLNWIEIISEIHLVQKWEQRVDTLLSMLNQYYVDQDIEGVAELDEIRDKIMTVSMMFSDL